MNLVKVATCNLCQWSLDFDLNLKNIIKSIDISKKNQCLLRTGSELELCGYSCEDHFLEIETFYHCWKSIEYILVTNITDNILCDIGIPILHNNIRYNCRIFILNRKIILIRPKMDLADNGNYRESRYFTQWTRMFDLDTFYLPANIRNITGQSSVPFGAALIELNDTVIAVESCEELFTPNSPHILQSLNGAEIFVNGSGSHHQLRKLDVRLGLIKNATSKCGGAYLYANQQGCDGGRLYFDGCALVAMNGEILAQGAQFSVHDVEVVIATIDLDAIRSYRAAIPSRNRQGSNAKVLPRVKVDFSICAKGVPSTPIPARIHSVEEEIAFGPACWLWDYLRRSGAGGFFLPLSGGADSSSTASLVGVMCNLVVRGCVSDPTVLADVRRLVNIPDYSPTNARDLCNHLFHTCYMGTTNSSDDTRKRAANLSREIGSYHLDTNIDSVVSSMTNLFVAITGKVPKFKVHGGTNAENLALQNIQARLRMVLSYFLAQLIPWTRSKTGWLLVLGSSTVDEALRGYLTKYDCSSADINPIGGISKIDLAKFLKWAANNMGYTSLLEVASAKPSAELEPRTETYKQVSEEDMGLTFEELGIFGRLRKVANCGPVSIFENLLNIWKHLTPTQIGEKVKLFFTHYSINRHKTTTLTPSYHAENYSPDDNRFDHRQFLYNVKWPRQFQYIDKLVQLENDRKNGLTGKL